MWKQLLPQSQVDQTLSVQIVKVCSHLIINTPRFQVSKTDILEMHKVEHFNYTNSSDNNKIFELQVFHKLGLCL